MHKPKDAEPTLDVLAQMGYETRDVALNTIARWIIFLFVFIAATTLVTLFLYYNVFVPNPASTEANKSASLTTVRRIPPQPLLQAHPKRDMIQYHAQEDRIVGGYTWADKSKGTVNIPIDQAVDRLAERGIAGVTGTQAAPQSEDYPGSGNYTHEQERSRDAADGEIRQNATSATGPADREGQQTGTESGPNNSREQTDGGAQQ